MMLPLIQETPLPQARAPFHFNSAAHLMLIGRERATNLQELLEALRNCPDDSIFQHTFRTLQEHHFIRQGFSNDFALWAVDECQEVSLGEKLASLDVREFTSIGDLRRRIVQIVEDHLKHNSLAASRPARKPFYFCGSDTVVLPTAFVAANLKEFAEALKHVTIHSIHYHFIEARLRLKLRSNDFSVWLDEDLGLPRAAALLNSIDIYTSTLEGVRRKIVRIVESVILKAS
ncbi:MAG TPA: DUF5752 family protein [Alphaproteobacteria bacterium]|nr:DUF5752 family protein [Alphaproteobacteria bacterium]